MRRLILKMSISLDGFVAGPNGEGDWMVPSRDEGGREWVGETLAQAGLHLMGRKSFFSMADYWPTAGDALAVHMNEIPKAVFTRQDALDVSSAGSGNWPQAEVIRGDLVAEVNRLKQQPGKYILAQGGVEFAQHLAAAGLIDEYRLVVHPVALGSGQALFARLPKPLHLQLRSSTVFRSGAMAQVFRPA